MIGDSTLTPRIAPSDEMVEAVTLALHEEHRDAFGALSWEALDESERGWYGDLARVAIEAYQKATSGEPRGEANETLSSLPALEEELRGLLEKLPERWQLPWTRYGNSATFFAHNSRWRRVMDVPIAYKTSAEMGALADYIYAASHHLPALLSSQRRLREALDEVYRACLSGNFYEDYDESTRLLGVARDALQGDGNG